MPARRIRYLTDILSLSGGTALAQAIALAAIPALTGVYQPLDYGEYTFFLAIASLLTVPASVKIEHAIMLPRRHREAARLLLSLVGWSLVVSMLLSLLIGVAHLLTGGEAFGRDFSFVIWCCAMPATVFFMCAYQGLRTWHLRFSSFTRISTSMVASIALGLSLSLILGHYPLKGLPQAFGLVAGCLLQYLVGAGILLGGMSAHSRRFRRIHWSTCLESLGRYRSLFGTLVASHGIAMTYGRLPELIIGTIYGAGPLGYYGLCQRIIAAPIALVANAVGDVYRNRAAEKWRIGLDFHQLFKETLLMVLLLAVPIFFAAWLLLPFLFTNLLAESWADGLLYARILLIGGFLAFVISPVDKGAVIVGAHRYIFTWHLLRLVAKLIIFFVALTWALSVETALALIVGARCLFYLADLVYEARFAKLVPGTR